MSADNLRSANATLPVALLFGANALTQFAIQAWLAYGFADEVWGLAQPLPWAAPLALDVFAITLMAAAYVLRNAPMRQRAYVWFWLAVVIGAQVGAAEGFADHKQWDEWGRIASLFPSIFLAASLHALIIVRRKQDHAAPATTARLSWTVDRAVAREVRTHRKEALPKPMVRLATAHMLYFDPPEALLPGQAPLPEPVMESPVEPPAPAPLPKSEPARRTLGSGRPKTRPAAVRQQHSDERAQVIRRCVDGEEQAKAVAVELGVGVRTAQLWVSKERTARAHTASNGHVPATGP